VTESRLQTKASISNDHLYRLRHPEPLNPAPHQQHFWSGAHYAGNNTISTWKLSCYSVPWLLQLIHGTPFLIEAHPRSARLGTGSSRLMSTILLSLLSRFHNTHSRQSSSSPDMIFDCRNGADSMKTPASSSSCKSCTTRFS
jgi:hypothetical protein